MTDIIASIQAVPADSTVLVSVPADMPEESVAALSEAVAAAVAERPDGTVPLILIVAADVVTLPLGAEGLRAMLDELLGGTPYASADAWEEAKDDFIDAVLARAALAAAGRVREGDPS